jgi:hypothetical protein
MAPSCNSARITGLTTWVFSGRIKAGPLKCTDPTVGGKIANAKKEKMKELRGGDNRTNTQRV